MLGVPINSVDLATRQASQFPGQQRSPLTLSHLEHLLGSRVPLPQLGQVPEVYLESPSLLKANLRHLEHLSLFSQNHLDRHLDHHLEQPLLRLSLFSLLQAVLKG